MYHYFSGEIKEFGLHKFIVGEVGGLEVYYEGQQLKGEFFVYPYIDDNKKTVVYFAFDNISQRDLFVSLLKISGVGPKTAFLIAQSDANKMKNSIKNLDVKFFQQIPGIGPKTARKILLELKDTIKEDEFQKINMDQKLYKDIIKSLQGFGYDVSQIKNVLQTYEGNISKENITEVVKFVISKM